MLLAYDDVYQPYFVWIRLGWNKRCFHLWFNFSLLLKYIKKIRYPFNDNGCIFVASLQVSKQHYLAIVKSLHFIPNFQNNNMRNTRDLKEEEETVFRIKSDFIRHGKVQRLWLDLKQWHFRGVIIRNELPPASSPQNYMCCF